MIFVRVDRVGGWMSGNTEGAALLAVSFDEGRQLPARR
jgi:hypothetical protein